MQNQRNSDLSKVQSTLGGYCEHLHQRWVLHQLTAVRRGGGVAGGGNATGGLGRSEESVSQCERGYL